LVRFRIPAFLIVLPLSCAWSFSVLGCDDNPILPRAADSPFNLVINGSFERPRVAGAEYYSYSTGDPLNGWSIDGPIDQLSGPIWEPADGTQSLDMDGSCGTGGIHQDIPTETGLTYDLHFALAGNPNGTPIIKALEVSWGDAVLDTVRFDTTDRTKGDVGWTRYDYVVVAPSERTRLSFRSLSPGCYGALLDAVSVRKIQSI
jgi:choice-of-anchor C domain-containing protein